MTNTNKVRIQDEPLRSIIFLTGLILIRGTIQRSLYLQGFISVAADEFSRGIRAAKWAANPRFDILADVQATWLPLEKYLNGLILLIWPDVILAPRATVFVASCLLLIIYFLLEHYLFNSFSVAAVSSFLVMLLPWYIWLSGTPMLEMYYLAFFFAGLLFLIAWLKESRKGFWIGAGFCFLVSSGFHVQSWTLINIVNLLTLPYLYKFFRERRTAKLAKLLAYYLLSNGLIIGFAIIEYTSTGEIFVFLAKHTSYSRWFYDGYNVVVVEKLLYYPRIVARQVHIVLWIYVAFALVFIGREQGRYLKLFPFLVAAAALLLNSVMNVFSGPPSAAPDRYSLFHVMVLILYSSYGLYRTIYWGWNRAQAIVRFSVVGGSVIIFLFAVYWGLNQIGNFPAGMPKDPIETGTRLNELLVDNPGPYMVELRYWDFLAVNLASLHFDDIVYDREQDIQNRDTESLFMQEPQDICYDMISSDIRYVALTSPDIVVKANQMNLLNPIQTIGSWTIYEVAREGGFIDCGSYEDRG